MDETIETSAAYESKREGESSGPEFVRMWMQAIELAQADQKEWVEDANRAVKVYRGEGDKKSRFNILYSNTETIVPAVYNSVPVPDIRRRYGDAGEPEKQVADVLERSISFSSDAYDLHSTLLSCVTDNEIVGRGVPRVRYRPTVKDEGILYQEVYCEHTPWDHFLIGPARSWSLVPWIAFKDYYTRAQLKELSPERGGKVPLDTLAHENEDKKADTPPPEIFKRATVWQIWDREARKVIYIAPGFKEGPVLVEDDPYELEGFFPVPRPIFAVDLPGTVKAAVPYEFYRTQAEELDDLTTRIENLTDMIRFKMAYAAPGDKDGTLTTLMEAEDGEAVAITDMQEALALGGLDKAIIFWPIEVLAQVRQVLLDQREATKASVFELIGIADIMRGVTDPDETAKAQSIKAQWGSLRVQRKQAEVQRLARDLFQLKAEIISQHFTSDTLALMTGIQLTPEADAILRNDVIRAYRIDIETDSTIRGDLARYQETMARFLEGTGAFLQATGPLVQQGILPIDLAMEVYGSYARQFKLGKSAEDAIERWLQRFSDPQVATQTMQRFQQQQNAPMELEREKIAAETQNRQADRQVQVETEKARVGADLMKMAAGSMDQPPPQPLSGG